MKKRDIKKIQAREIDKEGYETYTDITGEVWKIKPIPLFDMPPPATNGPLENHRVEFPKENETKENGK